MKITNLNYRNLLFRSSLVIALVFYTVLLVRFFTIGNISITERDEIPYNRNSTLFARYNSLKTFSCTEEDVSKILEGDWYGPGYPLIFGTFGKLSGDWDKSFILANLIFIILFGWLILKKFDIKKENKIWLLSTVLLFPAVFNHIFYFMPFTIDLLFAALLLLFIQKINKTDMEGKPISRSIILYASACLFISLFKQNFIFFSFAILAFSKNKKEFILFFGLIVLTFICTMIYGAFFLAPAYAKSLQSIAYLKKLDLGMFFTTMIPYFIGNISSILHVGGRTIPFVYIPVYVFLVLMFATTIIFALKSKMRILWSISLVIFTTFLAFTIFYSLKWYFFIRISAPLILMNLFIILLLPEKISRKLQIIITALFLLMIPLTYTFVKRNQDTKVACFKKADVLKNEFAEIKKYTKGKEISTILFDSAFFKLYDVTPFAMALPFANNEGNLIRYTVNYRQPYKFALLNKIKVDFVMTPFPTSFQYPTTLVEHNKHFYLYSINL